MRNPLMKRLPRELKSEFGKYLVIFLFLIGSIGIISGYLVACASMTASNDQSKEMYKVEDGNFELYFKGSDKLIEDIESKCDITVYNNYFANEYSSDEDATFRVYKKRTDIDLECLIEGSFPSNENEIAISKTFATNSNNNIAIGDKVDLDGITFEVSGYVSMSDYTTQFENATDMMFDSEKFTASIVTSEGFDRLPKEDIHYSYSYFFNEGALSDEEASKRSEDIAETISKNASMNFNAITSFMPAYANNAIIFAPDDIAGDQTMIEVLGYIIVILIAFIFGITINTTVTRESKVIGTLRASGYSRAEIIIHYMLCPMIVVTVASIIGNILGYTVFKDFCGSLYYNSYDLPTFKVLWNGAAFIKTTVIPFFICLLINFFTLYRKLKLSPLKFLRKDISSSSKKKAVNLSNKLNIMTRYRIRIILQNMANYITIFAGVLLASIFVVFGLVMEPLMNNYASTVGENMICDYQYILKAPADTSYDKAEKITMSSYKTNFGSKKDEEVLFYGIIDDSLYVDIDTSIKDNEIYISSAISEKYNISIGDNICFKDCYSSDTFEYDVAGIYEYPSICAVFMPQKNLNKIIGEDEDYFTGYLSDKELDDIDSLYISSKIEIDDMTKVSRQLTNSMGGMMKIVAAFGIITYMLVIYLLAKIIIEKNANSISMAKILGYYNDEINKLYIMSTTIVALGSFIVALPITNFAISKIWGLIISDYPGWFRYETPYAYLLLGGAIGIVAYLLIAFLLLKQVKKTPMLNALKAVE